MGKYGLVGKEIEYSFSKDYFTQKFLNENLTHQYINIDLNDLSTIEKYLQDSEIKGLNVTIPYKEKIIDFLDEIDPIAKKVGAVNTIKFLNNKSIGYNTDVYGFKKSLVQRLESHHKSAIIFGDGGAAKAIKYVLNELKINHVSYTRKGKNNFKTLSAEVINTHQIIINTTPVGTYPKIKDSLDIPFNSIGSQHLVYDLIYNPNKTILLQNAENQGAKIINGLKMLELQAEKSWEIWNS